jgi:hypothetical protein
MLALLEDESEACSSAGVSNSRTDAHEALEHATHHQRATDDVERFERMRDAVVETRRRMKG